MTAPPASTTDMRMVEGPSRKTGSGMEADRQAIRHFIKRVHGPDPAGWLVVWTRQDKATHAFDLACNGELDRAVAYCAANAADSDVYQAVGLQKERPSKGRGTEAGVCSVPGFWADIDIRGPAHKTSDLPTTEQEAMVLVEAVGLEPSVLVRSGFGLQVYWLFREPYRIETETEWQFLRLLSRRFQHNLRLHAQVHGWTVDPTADLCRVLRVPGTFNRKIPNDVRAVTSEYHQHEYNVSDFEDLLSGMEEPTESSAPPKATLAPANLPLVLEGCPWMRHCRDDATTLSEPEWYRMLTVVARCEEAEKWAHELSQPYPKYTPRETTAKLRQASGEKVAPTTCHYVQSHLSGKRFCSSCKYRGTVNSPIRIGRIQVLGHVEVGGQEDETPADSADRHEDGVALAEQQTDLGNARRFVARYGNAMRYCDRWGKWLVWDGKRWKEDDRLLPYNLGGKLIRSLRSLASRIKDEEERKQFLSFLSRSESHRSITAMINLAKADERLAVSSEDLDGHQWLLTVNNGTLDLKAGKLGPHRPDDLITKIAPVEYDPAAECPFWMAFLDMVMAGRRNLIEFLQRAFGSCLTGISSDKALFILYGPAGDNGKSTMVDAIQLLLGDYAVRTPVDTLLRKREGAIPNDIARLKGARFVWASENERGSRLSEALIKEMTGGDKLSARFMRAEFFEFYPEFKLWLATNHKPQVRGDQAIWRRLKLIPFDVSIPKTIQKPKHEVIEVFRRELPGILSWAVRGCMDWQKHGLGVPDEVLNATRQYETEQDVFGMFLEDVCVLAPNARTPSIALYRAYTAWAQERGETPMTHKSFAQVLSERGLGKSRSAQGVVCEGVGLKSAE